MKEDIKDKEEGTRGKEEATREKGEDIGRKEEATEMKEEEEELLVAAGAKEETESTTRSLISQSMNLKKRKILKIKPQAHLLLYQPHQSPDNSRKRK